MVKIAAIGASDFSLGFQLAGIRDSIVVGKEPMKQLLDIINNKKIGICVIDQKILDRLDSFYVKEIENSVKPVFIPLSTEATQDSLRRMIKKSIGVDLWKD